MNVYLAEKIKLKSSNINFLRFLCAIAVIICHSYAVTRGEEDFFSRFTKGQCNLGGVAVAVFFFFSGLYVTKSLDKTDSVWLFLKKRCERIFPSLWIAVLLCVIMGAMISELTLGQYLTEKQTYLYLLNGFLVPIHDLPGVFGGMPYSTVNGPLWTMPVEFACYIGLAIAAVISEKILRDKGKRKLLTIIATGALTAFFIYLQYAMLDNMIGSIVRAMIIFLEGVLYYEYRDQIKLNPILGGAALILFVLLGFTPVFNLGLILLFPYAVVSLSLALPQIKHDSKLFSISYEMYLVGWPIQQVVRMLGGDMNPTLNWLLTIPFDILIGWAIYSTIAVIMKHRHNRKRKVEGR